MAASFLAPFRVRVLLLPAALLYLFLGLEASLSAGSAASGDVHCDENALAMAREAKLRYPYQPRSPEPYCDGLTPRFNKGELDLVSLTLGSIRYTVAQAKLLIAVHADGRSGNVSLRGQDIRPDASYRLDGVIPSAGLSVNLSAVLHPAGIAAENLGLVAWRQVNGRIIYQPVTAGGLEPSAQVKVVLSTPLKVIATAHEVCTSPESGCGSKLDTARVEPLGNNQGSLIRFDVPCGVQASEVWVKVSTLSPGIDYGGLVIPLWLPARK